MRTRLLGAVGDLLEGLKQNLIYVIVTSLVAGLVAGQFMGSGLRSVLKSAVLPVIFVMIVPMMVNIDLEELVNIRGHAKPVVLSLVFNFVFVPLLAVGLSKTFFGGSPAYAVGLYFIALIPTSGMTAAWTGLAGGDLEASLVAVAVNLIAAVLVLPTYLSFLVQGAVDFDPASLYRQLAVVVVVPMALGTAIRHLLLRRYGSDGFKTIKPRLGGLSSLGVMLIVFIAMSMRSQSILADPVASGATVVPLVIFYAVILGVGSVVGRALLETEQSVAFVYATSMRNLSIAVGIVAASDFLPSEAVLPIALAYILQTPIGALYMHYRRDVVAEGMSIREAVGDIGV